MRMKITRGKEDNFIVSFWFSECTFWPLSKYEKGFLFVLACIYFLITIYIYISEIVSQLV
jgi:hypothetical protein